MPRRGSRLLAKLAERLKTAPQQQTDVKREIAEMLGPAIFYVREGRFEPVEDVEAVGEAEEVEDGIEPAEEAEEVAEDDEYLGQHVVRRVFPGERVGRTLF